MNNNRIIFTIDIDAFFAQVEEIKNPKYKNKPIVIGKLLNNRGIISTSNYAARKFNIYSGQPIYKAKQKVKDLIIIEPDNKKYVEEANKVFTIISKYSNKIQISSIDECFLDVTNFLKLKKIHPIEYAKKIQKEIFEKTKLTVSIGISNDKILSKIASNFDKPFGISTLFKYEIKNKLWNLDINKMYGIGLKTEIKLKTENINKIGDLANLKKNNNKYEKVKNEIGINLDKLINFSNGNSDNFINNNDINLNKSISVSKTFENNIYDYDLLIEKILILIKKLTTQLISENLESKTFSLQMKKEKNWIKFDNKKILERKYISKQATIKFPTNEYKVIKNEILNLLNKSIKEKIDVRYIGISAKNLIDKYYKFEQIKIYDFQNNEILKKKENELNEFIKDINLKIGKQKLATGEDFLEIKRFKNRKNLISDNIKFLKLEK